MHFMPAWHLCVQDRVHPVYGMQCWYVSTGCRSHHLLSVRGWNIVGLWSDGLHNVPSWTVQAIPRSWFLQKLRRWLLCGLTGIYWMHALCGGEFYGAKRGQRVSNLSRRQQLANPWCYCLWRLPTWNQETARLGEMHPLSIGSVLKRWG